MELIGHKIPEELLILFRKITNLAQEKKVKIYVVGGFVRDLMLQRPISEDIDFVLEGDAIEFAREFRKRFGGTRVVAYNRFGTAMLHHKIKNKNWKLEFVTAREEYYDEHSRKPHVQKANIESDLSRRDFTINAMALALFPEKFGELFDPHGGQKDLKQGIIKTPLDPKITFFDDPLRMMRAIRFASRFKFQIEEKTWEAIKEEKERLKIISAERITDELFRMLQQERPSLAIRLLKESGLLEYILPELLLLDQVEVVNEISHKNVFEHSLMVLDQVSEKTKDIPLLLAALLHDIGKPETKHFDSELGWTFHKHEIVGAEKIKIIGRRLKFSNSMVKLVSGYVKYHQWIIQLVKEINRITDSAIRRFLLESGELVEGLLILAECDITTSFPEKKQKLIENVQLFRKRIVELEQKDNWRNFKLAISGEDIMELFHLNQGKEVGIIKETIKEKIIQGEIENNRDSILQFLQNNNNKIKDWINESSGAKSKNV